MQICPLDTLIEKDFNIKFINALQQSWNTTKTFHCIGSPKKSDLLLYIHGYNVTYTDKSGAVFSATDGDVVYTAAGSEYTFLVVSELCPAPYTIGIAFDLLGSEGERIILSDNITIFRPHSGKTIFSLFHQAHSTGIFQPVVRKKILLEEILCSLASQSLQKNIPERILSSLLYLSEHIGENPSVASLAKMQSVSEVYFRKQFKEAIGMTPLEYRNLLRLEKASSLLSYGDISVQEISDSLGYSTVSHFIKEFRARYGTSPLQFRKQFRN